MQLKQIFSLQQDKDLLRLGSSGLLPRQPPVLQFFLAELDALLPFLPLRCPLCRLLFCNAGSLLF